MKLSRLIECLEVKSLHGPPPQAPVTGLAYDSRQVRPGMVFAALEGLRADGHDFAARAVAQGAQAILTQRPVEGAEGVCRIEVPDSRLALALMAREFYGRPSDRLTLAGVTGTNGKTTVSCLLQGLLARRGPAGVMGTVEISYPGAARPARTTTPESVDLQAVLAEMVAAGVRGAAMEISSHALVQHRAWGAALDLALFTNLSRDHLDYHGDMETYWQAKRRLFSELLPWSRRMGKNPAAVICLDDPRGAGLAAETREAGFRTITYALDAEADLTARRTWCGLEGSRMLAVWQDGEMDLATSLAGRYNLQNLLAAAAAGLALGMAPGEIKAGLESASAPPGRMERAPGPPGSPAVFVDYCHTPDALAGALEVLRPLTPGRLICVFGAGGDRDQGKRPLMGRAVGLAADLAVLTSDNPRTEDPGAIMAMIEPGLREAGCTPVQDPAQAHGRVYVAEPDRGRAITLALEAAGPDDVVLVAG